jgi:hypothetical protein
VKPSQDYVSYLLRLWRSGKGDKATWRALLESPLTGEHLGFANLQDLFVFLESLTSNEPEVDQGTTKALHPQQDDLFPQ